MATPKPLTDHIMMYKVGHDQDESKANAWIESLHSLSSLPEIEFITAGPITRARTFSGRPHYTHVSHARFRSPPHEISTIFAHGWPLMADSFGVGISYPADFEHKPLSPGKAIRYDCYRLKPGSAGKKGEILEGLKRVKWIEGQKFEVMSYGEEVLNDQADGFSVSVAAVFKSFEELDASKVYEDSIRSVFDKYKTDIDGEISFDYVVPSPAGTTNAV